MYLKTADMQYNLVEFNLFSTTINEKIVSVLEMLIDHPIEDFRDKALVQNFFIVSNETFYSFSDFAINEFYEDDDFIRVVCIK